jgi:hypothetical protein
MAAADSSAQLFYSIPVAILPLIVSPLLAWFLGRSRISQDSATIDYLNKRLDVLERLNKLHMQLAEGPIKPFLEIEIEHCRAFLHQPPIFIPRDAEVTVGAPQSRWARFFLTQPAGSVRKRIFKGLFYLFFGTAMLVLVGIPISLFTEPSTDIGSPTIFVMGFGFYFGLALLFRRWAR